MKIVIVLDGSLSPGVAANAAAALAFSCGSKLPACVGGDLADADGSLHPGIVNIPIPVLAAPRDRIAELRRRAGKEAGTTCIDFSECARRSLDYGSYEKQLGQTPAAKLDYLGVCIYGDTAAVTSLTGSLALFRK